MNRPTSTNPSTIKCVIWREKSPKQNEKKSQGKKEPAITITESPVTKSYLDHVHEAIQRPRTHERNDWLWRNKQRAFYIETWAREAKKCIFHAWNASDNQSGDRITCQRKTPKRFDHWSPDARECHRRGHFVMEFDLELLKYAKHTYFSRWLIGQYLHLTWIFPKSNMKRLMPCKRTHNWFPFDSSKIAQHVWWERLGLFLHKSSFNWY